jgi:DNA-binding transcriptional regulator YbjK
MSAVIDESERLERAMDAITSDPRECQELTDQLLAKYRDDLGELLTGAYGYAHNATIRFQTILAECEQGLRDRAERNLNEGRD